MSEGAEGEPVEIVRPVRTFHVLYSEHGDGWQATSPDIVEMNETSGSLAELQARVRSRLRAWLHPTMRVAETVLRRPVEESFATPVVVRIDRQKSFAGGVARATRATVRARVDVDNSRLAVGA